jgi:hypothetical protein
MTAKRCGGSTLSRLGRLRRRAEFRALAAQLMERLFASGHVADLLVALLALELAVLWWW